MWHIFNDLDNLCNILYVNLKITGIYDRSRSTSQQISNRIPDLHRLFLYRYYEAHIYWSWSPDLTFQLKISSIPDKSGFPLRTTSNQYPASSLTVNLAYYISKLTENLIILSTSRKFYTIVVPAPRFVEGLRFDVAAVRSIFSRSRITGIWTASFPASEIPRWQRVWISHKPILLFRYLSNVYSGCGIGFLEVQVLTSIRG